MNRGGGLLGMVLWLTAVGATGSFAAATDAPNDELVQTIITLLIDKDQDMRAMGLQQVREEVKGPAATKRFADLLPTLPPDARPGLLAALADRGDNTARPAVLAMLKSGDEQVRAAAIRAIGSLGQTADVPVLVNVIASAAAPEKTVALASLIRLRGQTVNAAIVAEAKAAKPKIREELLGVLVTRRAIDTVPDILMMVEDADSGVRISAMAALGALAAPECVADMLKGVLKAEPGPEREAAERDVMFVCNRIEDMNKRADPLLAALAPLEEDSKTNLLPVLGRVGGPAVLAIVEAAIADKAPQRRDAGIRALCNWPNASVASKLIDLAQTADDATHRTLARKALIRVAALPDKRSDAERLALVKKAMTMAASDEERNLVLTRVRAVRTIETLRFVTPYLNKPEYAQAACATVVELAHHRKLREPNKAEFDEALDAVIRIGKDPGVVDRAKRYKKGQT